LLRNDAVGAAATLPVAAACACGLASPVEDDEKEEVVAEAATVALEALVLAVAEFEAEVARVLLDCDLSLRQVKYRSIASSASASVVNDAKYVDEIFLRSFASDSSLFVSGSRGGKPDSLRKRRRSLLNRPTVSNTG
jgi:hypothetical protein